MDDWEIDEETFKKSNRKFIFTIIDMFASDCNTKSKKFISNFYSKGTIGIDELSLSWDREVAWMCSPIREVIKVIGKLKTSKTTIKLFIPEWKTTDNWTKIFDREGRVLWPFKNAETRTAYFLEIDFDSN